MADMLGIGTQAANTYKTALDVTSHNVANVGTDGYSRQRAEIYSNTPSLTGAGFNGGGSRVDSVLRIQSEFIQMQLNSSNAGVERYDQQLSLAKQIEGVIASNDEGVQQFMQRFFDSLQEVADNPTSSISRQMVLDEAGNMETHIGNLTTVLSETETQINGQVKGLVTEINDRLDMIQKVNQEVTRALDTGSQPPNDLLDQRDQAILELSGYIDIKTFPQEDGGLDIFTSAGNLPLLADNHKTNLSAELSPYTNDNRVEVYMSLGGQKQVISDRISGGQLGGVLDVRDNMLDSAQNELGLMLNGMVSSVNWQHYQGYDLNGDAGQNFFQPMEVNAIQSSQNTGAEDGSNIVVKFNPNSGEGAGSEPPYDSTTPPEDDQPATYGDKQAYLSDAFSSVGEFVARDYEIRMESDNSFKVFDYKTGEQLQSVAAGTTSFQVEGFEFDLSAVGAGGIQPGDKFLIKPHEAALEQFQTVMNDPDKIAARGQSPVPATVDNDGDGTIEALNDSVPAPAAYGDNVNIANMASLQSKKLLLTDETGQPTENLLGGYSKMASNVGMYVRGSEIQLTAQQNVHDQMVNQRESLSGVSLDEEAANLMRFQQAYEASAQIISTSQSIFQTLLGAMRG